MGSKYSIVFSTNNGELLCSKGSENYYWKYKNQLSECRVIVTIHKDEKLDNVILVHDGKSYNFKWINYDAEYCFTLDHYGRYSEDDKIISRKHAYLTDIYEEKMWKFIFEPGTVKIYTIDVDNVTFSLAVIFLPLVLTAGKTQCE